jgi:hypothetical protein
MTFNFYIDKRTDEKLQRLARRRRTTRNALVRAALAHLLARDTAAGWPEVVLGFHGVEGATRFESLRRQLAIARRKPAQRPSDTPPRRR